jgi:hypothetical protein
MWKVLGREALDWLVRWCVRRGLDELERRTGKPVAERLVEAELGALAAAAATVPIAIEAAEQRGREHPLDVDFEIVEPEK